MEELGEPAEDGGLFVVMGRKGLGAKDRGGVDDGEAAVAFSAHGVVLEGLEKLSMCAVVEVDLGESFGVHFGTI